MEKIFFIVIFILSAFPAFNQTDTIDSVLAQNLTLDLMIKADSARRADSLQKEFLLNQLNNLTATEIQKRQELEQQLRLLNTEDSLRKIKILHEIDSLKLITKSYPIVPFKDTLFLIYTKIGNITAKERSEIITERLKELYKHYILNFDSLTIVDYGQSIDIVFKNKTIITISEYDAMWFGKSKMAIANNYKNLILNDIEFYKSNKSLMTFLKQVGLALFVIIFQIFLIRFINKLFKNKADKYINSQKGKLLKGIKIKDYQFLDEERLTNVMLFISKMLRWLINIIQLYITIPILFSIFPPTQRLAETLFSYILTPLKKIGSSVLHYLPNLFTIIVIVIITRYIVKFIKFLSNEVEAEKLKIPGFYSDWARPTFNIVRFLVLAFMFVMIFPYLPGSDSPIFKGVSVFIGIMFSLGSSSIIGNMVAGLVMTYMRPFQIGDRIKINEVVGDVVERTAFVTRVKTTKKEIITIPNSNILSSNVVNYSALSKTEGVILYSTVTIGYDVPWRTVHDLLISAAEKTNNVLEIPEPFVLQTSLDDFYVSYQLNVHTLQANKQPQIYSELHQHIQDVFNEAKIEILSPHYRAQRDGNQVTNPEEYLDKDYQAPSFRFMNIFDAKK
ncbi:MAG: mechanosensitive ion channel family protein [Bacteroidales bacterium]|nr:mechanosensitive ion channel family protein [Bacteroidales bacterium]